MTHETMHAGLGGNGTKPKWGYVIGAGALTLKAFRSSASVGVPLAIAGAALLYRGLRGPVPAYGQRVKVTTSMFIRRSPEELYRYWRDFRNLPIFMKHLNSVAEVGPNRWHWEAALPGVGMPVSWDSEITEERPDKRLRWRSLPGSDVYSEGEVAFRLAPGGRGTEVRIAMEYRPGGTALTAASALFDTVTAKVLKDELRRFKELMEGDEFATIEGHPT